MRIRILKNHVRALALVCFFLGVVAGVVGLIDNPSVSAIASSSTPAVATSAPATFKQFANVSGSVWRPINPGEPMTVTLDKVIRDDNGMLDQPNNRICALVDGHYRVSAIALWELEETGSRGLVLNKHSAAYPWGKMETSTAVMPHLEFQTSHPLEWSLELKTGECVSLWVGQSSKRALWFSLRQFVVSEY